MGLLGWVLMGALMLLALAISARIMRKGVSTLDENRKLWLDGMAETGRRLEEDRKNMAASEHLAIIGAAVEDLLRLDNFPAGWQVCRENDRVELQTPEGKWSVELIMRERSLRSSGKVLHGKSRWRLCGPAVEEEHEDAASLMRSLNGYLHDKSQKNDVPQHLARRMRHLPQEPH